MGVQVIVSNHVRDYDAWHQVFTEHGEVRRSHGATGHTVYHSLDDAGAVTIVNEFPDEASARALLADPSLRDAMARAGVDSEPLVRVCKTEEVVTY